MRFPQKNTQPYYIPYNQFGQNPYTHIPLYVNYGRTRGSGFGSIFSLIGRHLLPFAKKYIAPKALSAVKQIGEDIISGENVLKSAKARSLQGLKEIGEESLLPFAKRAGSGIKESVENLGKDIFSGKNILESTKSNIKDLKTKLMKGGGIRQSSLYKSKPDRNIFGDLNLKYKVNSRSKSGRKKVVKRKRKIQKGGAYGRFKKRKSTVKRIRKKRAKKQTKKRKKRVIYPTNSVFDF